MIYMVLEDRAGWVVRVYRDDGALLWTQTYTARWRLWLAERWLRLRFGATRA